MKKAFGIGVFLLVLSLPLWLPHYPLHLACTVGIFVILSVSLNIVVGFAGQISLGHAAFFAVGAYTSSLLAVKFGIPFWFGIFVAGMVSSVFGILLGVPTLRVRDIYLSVVTICFGLMVQLALVNLESITGGARGIYGIPRPSIAGFSFVTPQSFYYIVLFFALFTIFSALRLLRSRFGRAFLSIRENELAAETVGIRTTYYKILAFAISSFYAGMAGSLYAHYVSYINPDAFTFGTSVDVLVMIVIGGLGNVWGSVIGAIVITLLPEYLRFMQQYYRAVFGIGLVLMMVFMRSGVISVFQRIPWGRSSSTRAGG
jgi:branched-chain amino acid transport system permease protein